MLPGNSPFIKVVVATLIAVVLLSSTAVQASLTVPEIQRPEMPEPPEKPEVPQLEEELPQKGAREVRMEIGNRFAYIDLRLYDMATEPFIEKGRTFVPVRFLANSFGAEADWTRDSRTGRTETVTLERRDKRLSIDIGEDSFELYRAETGAVEEIGMDVEAVIRNGRTFLPFRALAEAFGADVNYSTDHETGKVDYVWFTQL